MSKKKLLLIFFLFLYFSSIFASDYEACNISINSTKDELDNIPLHYIDTIYFLTVGPIALILCLGFLIFLIAHRELLKKQPGDLYFGATFAELLLAIHWIISGAFAIYDRIEGNKPRESDSAFCQSNAFISFFAGTWEMVYNICFCIYMIQKIKTLLNPIEISKIYYHSFSFLLSLGITILLGTTGHLGKNSFGTCSLVAHSPVAFLGPVVLAIYYIFAFYAIFYFKNYLPDNAGFTEKKKFLCYYNRYIIVTSLVWVPIAAINIIYLQAPDLDIVLTIGNICKLNTPIALTLMRMKDPYIKKKMNEVFLNMTQKNKKTVTFSIFFNEEEKSGNSPLDDKKEKRADLCTLLIDRKQQTIIKSINYETPNELSDQNFPQKELSDENISDELSRKTSNLTLDSKKKMESENEFYEKEENFDYFLSSLTENAKYIYIKSMLIGILLNLKRMKERKSSKSFSFFNLSDFSEKSQSKKLDKNIVFNLDSKVIKDELPEVWEKFSDDMENINLEITYFSQKLFDELIIKDFRFLELSNSLAIDSNIEQIKHCCKADGGRGGQFFFFSNDNKIIVKSLSDDDLKCLKKLIKPYYEYMVKNNDSLIMKIYGVYEFKFYNNKKKKNCIFSQKVMIMRNLRCFPKFYVEKTYDLKGSTFQRESLAKKNAKENSVLKDIDFLKIEKKLFIDKERKKEIKEIIKRDSMFFKTNGIIDYSLLIIKLNLSKKEEFPEWGTPFGPIITDVNGVCSLDSTKENNIKYHIGIIDYLQPYNYKKILEKYSKKLIKANMKLDTSSQSPNIYSERFCKFIDKILDDDNEKEENLDKN